MEKYHDKEYDGIVLKFPRWFIDLNKEVLEPLLVSLEYSLVEKMPYSTFHPDHVKNINEVKDYKGKLREIERQKEIELERKNNFEKKIEQKYSLEVLDVEEASKNVPMDFPYHFFGKSYEEKEIFTKNGIRTSFQKEMNQKFAVASPQELKDLFKNCFYLDYEEHMKSYRLIFEDAFMQDTYGKLCIRYMKYFIILPSNKNKPKSSGWYGYTLNYDIKDNKYYVGARKDYDKAFMENYDRVSPFKFYKIIK